MEIKQSFDYHHFKTITGNRNLSEKKVQNIINDINTGLNLLPYCPIIIYNDNNTSYIIDGQHRFEVSKKLKKPVYYIECEKISLQQIAKVNSRSDKWTNKNFLDCYVNIGIKDYVILRDFIKKYNLAYSAAIGFLMTGKIAKGGIHMEEFRNGEFKVKHFELADKIVNLTTSLFEIYNFYNDRYLISAMHEIYDKGKCDFNTLRRKIKEAPNEMNKNSAKKDYMYNVERVYNYKNQNRVSLF